MKIESNSAEETFALGKQCGEKAAAGQVYCLYGDLGVGKTVFTKGFAAGLGIKEPVSSPTFTILQVYDEGRLPFYHFDVYRISDPEEMCGADVRICPTCGKEVVRDDMLFTHDCHGIAFRLVCFDCYEKLMAKGYDGQYYDEADECLDEDY